MKNKKEIQVIVTKDGNYNLYDYQSEVELEKMIVEHSSEIFGKDTHYFKIKKKISSRAGLGTIPDGYVIDLEKKKLYIVEVELISHDIRKHIESQILSFIKALRNEETCNKLVETFNEELSSSEKIKEKELKSIIANRGIIILIDDIGDPTKGLTPLFETVNILSELAEVKVITFQTYIKDNIFSQDHVHSFKAFTREGLENESKKWTFKWTTVPVEERLEKLDDNLKEVFIELGEKICGIADNIKEEHTKSGYTTYQISKLKNFCAIKFPRGCLKIHMKVNKDKFIDPKKITKDIERTSNWTFDKVFTIKSRNDIGYAISLIRQAYECICKSKID